MSKEEQLIAILKIVNQSSYGWLNIDSNEAKEIRKNAVQAFLEAKNIKNKYNLQTLLESDSSDEEFFDLDN